ncbi:voltage-gated potassium channel [Treponema rectale]|uniref:Voltage-gated potassium channel n=1 Tax=Treponema rectale TaxID=744512 RepID=A0A840SGN6_9SPIR|nr:potassium channel family protein [Treponema rectale]MBB5219900.1 voltage-gated potassium channel [Treponema rectale]
MKKDHKSRKQHFLKELKYIFLNPFTWAWLLIAFILVIITAINRFTETDAGILSWWDSIWFSLVTIAAGYYEYSPATVPGRIASFLLLIFGMLVLSAITGRIASYFLDIQLKKEKGLLRLKNMKGHFIICGWRAGFDKILDYVLISNPDITTDMIVLINEATGDQIDTILSQNRFKGIHFVGGDFSDEAVLNRAQVEKAERALIISDQSKKYSQLEIDSRTVLAVLTIKNINPEIYIAAELTDSKFQNHLHMAHCDEIILTSDYEYSLLATASSGMGYSNVISALISKDADTGIIVDNIEPSFIGKTYKDLKNTFTDSKEVLVGLLLNTGNFHQRRKDALREAQKNPDIKKVIDELKKVKSIKSNSPLLTPDDNFIIPPFTKAIFVRGNTED